MHRYKVGETFIHMPQPKAVSRLEKDTKILDSKIADLDKKVAECAKEMGELKVELYAKFGRNINLDE
jgi:prefoldin subunit 4